MEILERHIEAARLRGASVLQSAATEPATLAAELAEHAPPGSLKLCVFAPWFDRAARSLPFNLKRSGAAELLEANVAAMRVASEWLAEDGLLFVYGLPAHLARYATAVAEPLSLRYWIGVRASGPGRRDQMRPEHMGLLVIGGPSARLQKFRIPHAICRACGDTLKDWGGKSHLMRPDGVALSDVWMDLVIEASDPLPLEIFERILQLAGASEGDRVAIIAPDPPPARPVVIETESQVAAFDPLRWLARGTGSRREVPDHLIDRLHKAPCLEVLRAIPSETIDLAFADPPFNLTKNYNGYLDARDERDYLGWCKRWLLEYERVVKPGGALVVLNLPRWATHLAEFLSRTGDLHLQNWIVWNALPEPKGALLPAHYALLYFTKGERPARFNYCSMEQGWQPFDEAVFPPNRPDVCQRRACIRRRRSSSALWRGELTDIWYDIHRERRPRRPGETKIHPCATPERLLDRVIRLTTNAGDVVLDAFAGTGTSALVARRLGRRFIAIEQDGVYLEAASRRLYESRRIEAAKRRSRFAVSKRRLQIEIKRLALMLGRLPSKLDIVRLSNYRLEAFEEAFASWSEALKAAKVALASARAAAEREASTGQLSLFGPATAAEIFARARATRALLRETAKED